MRYIILILFTLLAVEVNALTQFVAMRGDYLVANWTDERQADGSIRDEKFWKREWGSQAGVTVNVIDLSAKISQTKARIDWMNAEKPTIDNLMQKQTEYTNAERDQLIRYILKSRNPSP